MQKVRPLKIVRFFFLFSIYLDDNISAPHTTPILAAIIFLMLSYFIPMLPWNLDILLHSVWWLLLRVVSITMDIKTRSALR